MIQDIKNTVKQSAVYGLSRISFKLIAFILFPIYSIYFSVDEYGIIVRGDIFWQLLQSFILYSIETAIIRWYSLLENSERKKSLIFSVFSFLLFINVILLTLSFLFPEQISQLLFNSSKYPDIVQICFMIAMFETLIGIPLVYLRINEKVFTYVIIVSLESIISLACQVYFITATDYKITGVFISKAIGSLTIFIIILPVLIKSIKIKFDYKLLKEVLKFCIPLMAASLVSSLFNTQDRFILGYLTDSREVGLYGLGFNIAGLITFLFISPFALAYPTIFWKKIKDDNAKRYYTKSMTYSFLVFVFGALVLSLIAPHFIKIFARNPDYWLAKNIVPIIAFSLAFYGMHVVGFMSFYHEKKTNVVLLILILSSALDIMLNFILIPSFKMYGAAISIFISFLISTILVYSFSKKYYFIKWENYKLFITMLTAIALVIPFYLFNIENIFMAILLKIMAIFIFPVILYYLRFYETIEIITIKNYFKSFIKK